MFNVNNELTKVRLRNSKDKCHMYAMEYIDIVTSAAGQYMQENDVDYDHELITPEGICSFAASKLGVDFEELKEEYFALMHLEKMIEFA